MKKLLFIIALFTSFFASAQEYGPKQYIGGNAGVETSVRGITGADSSVYLARFADTSVANRGKLKLKPFLIIATADNNIWVRSGDATRWIQLMTNQAPPNGTGLDSVTRSPDGNTYCFWQNNNSTCFDLGKYFDGIMNNYNKTKFILTHSGVPVDSVVIPHKYLVGDGENIIITPDGEDTLIIRYIGVQSDVSFRWTVQDSLSTPPVSPQVGYYEVSTAPTAATAFAGHAKQIAYYGGSLPYTFETPVIGDVILNLANEIVSRYNGTAWIRGKLPVLVDGNAYKKNISIGPLDAFNLSLITNGVQRFQITPTGGYRFNTLSSSVSGLMQLDNQGIASRINYPNTTRKYLTGYGTWGSLTDSATNIYRSDGSLTGPRILSGNGYSLTMDALNNYTAGSNIGGSIGFYSYNGSVTTISEVSLNTIQAHIASGDPTGVARLDLTQPQSPNFLHGISLSAQNYSTTRSNLFTVYESYAEVKEAYSSGSPFIAHAKLKLTDADTVSTATMVYVPDADTIKRISIANLSSLLGGGVGGAYIPLAGNDISTAVTGDIVFGDYKKITTDPAQNETGYTLFGPGLVGNYASNTGSGHNSSVIASSDAATISSTAGLANVSLEVNGNYGIQVLDRAHLYGIFGEENYSINYTDLSYVQKRYVDSSIAASSGGAGTPGGANKNVQFNDGGSFGGDNNFRWAKDSSSLIFGTNSTSVNGNFVFIDGGYYENLVSNANFLVLRGSNGIGGLGGSVGTQAGSADLANAGGDNYMIAGDGGPTGLGGNLYLNGGNGGTTSGDGGNISINGGLHTNGANHDGSVDLITGYRINLNSPVIRINGAYSIPVVDGTSGQVLQTNGAGVVTWQTVASGSSTTQVTNERFTGSTSSTITLAHTISANLVVKRNGVTLDPTSDYSGSGTTVTLTGTRLSGDVYLIDYKY